jgi:hypothetical protein
VVAVLGTSLEGADASRGEFGLSATRRVGRTQVAADAQAQRQRHCAGQVPPSVLLTPNVGGGVSALSKQTLSAPSEEVDSSVAGLSRGNGKRRERRFQKVLRRRFDWRLELTDQQELCAPVPCFMVFS